MAYHSNENEHADTVRRVEEREAGRREAERTRNNRQMLEHHWATTLKNSSFLSTLLRLSKDNGVEAKQLAGDRPGDPPYWRFKHRATMLVLIPDPDGVNAISTRGDDVSPPERIDLKQAAEGLFRRCFESK